MDIRDYVQIAESNPPLRFLIIGGYAVAAHGHSRATFDVDFLVASDDRHEWKRRFLEAGFKLISESFGFAQFNPPDESTGLDLMFVQKDTFEQFFATSELRTFGDIQARVPSLDHLLALKLHVLKQGLAHRTFKDAEDVEILAKRNNLNLEKEHYENLFLKYQPQKSTKPSKESRELADLVLPVDPEFKPLPPLLALDEYCRLNKQFCEMFPHAKPTEEERRARKLTEMFEL